jgi:hypothetical protein
MQALVRNNHSSLLPGSLFWPTGKQKGMGGLHDALSGSGKAFLYATDFPCQDAWEILLAGYRLIYQI